MSRPATIAPFNPTLVRLRQDGSRTDCPRCGFQSHLGSIAAPRYNSPTVSILPSFQSHLGSIAALSPGIRARQGRDFQSHLGSIAAILPSGVTTATRRLSIPPWFDCGLSLCPCAGARGLLSIPPWFDCGVHSLDLIQDLPVLSIPPWFDCGSFVRGAVSAATVLSIPPWFDCGTSNLHTGRV